MGDLTGRFGAPKASSAPLMTDSFFAECDANDTMTGVGDATALSGVVSREDWRPLILMQEDSSCL